MAGTQESTHIPRLLIAAPQGRSGKTTVTLGLVRTLKLQGMTVQPFKKGPDYIDPSWLTLAAGRPCRNLDPFLMSEEQVRQSLCTGAQGGDLSIIEGAMGLYDGLDVQGSTSTAEIARMTQTPVLLVLDITRMTRSAAALVMGCQTFDPRIQIVGVILNKVARPRHANTAREAIEHYCGVPVLGAISAQTQLEIPDRHLGLVPSWEYGEAASRLDEIAVRISSNLDLTKVLKLAQRAPRLSWELDRADFPSRSLTGLPRVKVGVIKDRVFSFYYPENLAALTELGAELVVINSLADRNLPKDLSALYIGGGFPELFTEELEANESLRRDIKTAALANLPIYAECGGLMYLGRSIQSQGTVHQMVGALPLDTKMLAKPQGHGYTLLQPVPGNSWFCGGVVKGHEFHNSRVINLSPDVKFAMTVQRGRGLDGKHEGICWRNIFAAYNHIHAAGYPPWAKKFIEKALEFNGVAIAESAFVGK